MNRFTLIIPTFVFSVLFICTSCEKEESTKSPYIDGLTIDNYPIIDGSTSTLPLNTVIACELLGLNYQWQENKEDNNAATWSMEPQIKGSLKRKFDRKILSSQTHNSYINLIDKKADIVLSARTMSSDEKAYADSKGVTLIEMPIALDALIFIVNPQNEINGLTTEEIQGIYTGKITEWTECGWKEIPDSIKILLPSNFVKIYPFIRNPNSGSQELMDLLVMKDFDYIDLPMYKENLIRTMLGMRDEIASNTNAIGYTVYYYNEQIIRAGNLLKTIAVDGVLPNKQNISNRSYPYATEVYAVIRSDTDKSSMTYRIYEWLQTETGKRAITKSGYLLN